MKDIRVSIRLTKEQHEQLKILVIKKNTNINSFILKFIKEQLEKDKKSNE